MNKFYVTELTSDSNFNALLLLANSDAPLTPINEIEKAISKIGNGRIIIDQILHSGNTGERYICLDIVAGKVNQSSISFYTLPKGDNIRKLSRQILYTNNLIDYSILSSIQKRMLKKGIPI